MVTPADVDPVLWQQAVDRGARAVYDVVAFESTRSDEYYQEFRQQWQDAAAAALSAAFGVLQQATRAQIPAELRQMASDYERGGYEETAGYAVYFASVFDARVARGETP